MNSPSPTEKPNGICTCILDKCNCILAPKKKKNKNYVTFPLILNENKSNNGFLKESTINNVFLGENKSNNIFLEENISLLRKKRKRSNTIYS
tara:strand:+ start:1113 stop:1388 length:276 start_codon:yes stop_codon:yes gene_type:complete